MHTIWHAQHVHFPGHLQMAKEDFFPPLFFLGLLEEPAGKLLHLVAVTVEVTVHPCMCSKLRSV